MALLGNLKGSAQVFQDTEFYNGAISQSLRLSVGSNYKLDRQMVTPTSVTGTICTASWWMKKSAHGTVQSFIQCRDNQSSGNYAAYWTYDTGFGSYDHHAFRNEVDSLHVGTDTSIIPYRDASSWYHVVIRYDSTQSTAADRIRIYKNGVLQNSTFATTSYPSQNHVDTYWNNAGEHLILFGNGEDSGDSFDGYIAEFNWVDGQSLPPETFGESKNGVWIPKKITLSTSDYGLNGSRYTFADSSDIGKDTSGVGNDLDRVSNLSAHDVVPDSPENNFCTLNSLGRRYGQSYMATFSEGNLKAATGGNASHVYGTMAINEIASQGGAYFEIRLDSQDVSRTYVGVIGDNGTDNKNSASNGASYQFPIKGLLRPSSPDGSMGVYFTTSDGVSMDLSSHNTTYSNGDVVGVAILSDGKTFFHKNGTYLDDSSGNVGNPSTGANPLGTLDLTTGDWLPYVGYNSTFSINFGQDSTFAGQESSGGNSDANGIGDFMFAVPTNCLALCTSNMAEPTIGPNSATQSDDHFNTVLYTGDGSGQSITGVGFQPDWTWIKSRSHASSHVLTDSSRGVTKSLFSDNSDAETTLSGGVTAFGTDGFTLGSEGTVNTSSRTYVGWNWKANGGTTSSNSDGTITSTVQANTTAGFSIVTYTGTGSNATVGHGLSEAPDIVLVKGRSNSTRFWTYWGTQFVNTSYIYLNTDNGEDTGGATITNSTYPSSTVFSIGTSVFVNGSSETYVAYCFHEVEGYSKFGSYIARSSSASTPNHDGIFIYLGFRPAWIIIKRIDGTGTWNVHDSVRSSNNPMKNFLLPNTSAVEQTSEAIEFLSNGVKLRSASGYFDHPSGGEFIYAAFAEAPFKYANGR